jgi:hypothetical protein
MHLLTITAIAFMFSCHALAANNYTNLTWVKNTWTIESPQFSHKADTIDPIASTNLGFKLYYHKWNACNTSSPAVVGSTAPPDPELCGLDLWTSEYWADCSSRFDAQPNALWHACQGRYKPKTRDDRCIGLVWYNMGSNGCRNDPNREEDVSEREWVRWRIIKVDESKLPPKNASYRDPWEFYRSMTVEVVNGQRLV